MSLLSNLKRRVLTACTLSLCAVLHAQNPFVTKADVIMKFQISPDEQAICCSWWGADGMSKIRVKDMKSGKTVDVDSIDIMNYGLMPFDALSFISNEQFVYAKGEKVRLYDLKKNRGVDLFDLHEKPTSITASKDGKGFFSISESMLSSFDMKGSVRNTVALENEETVMSASATADNGMIYCLDVKKEGVSSFPILKWDGVNPEKSLTEIISKIITPPYLIEATSEIDVYFAVNKEGVHRLNLQSGKSEKLFDQSKERPIAELKTAFKNERIYYKTNNQKNIVYIYDLKTHEKRTLRFDR